MMKINKVAAIAAAVGLSVATAPAMAQKAPIAAQPAPSAAKPLATDVAGVTCCGARRFLKSTVKTFASLLPALVATLPMAIAALVTPAMPRGVAPRTADGSSYAAATPHADGDEGSIRWNRLLVIARCG